MAEVLIQGPRGPLFTVPAKATHVADGDTIDVQVPGETDTRRIRLCGVNTWELDDYSGVGKGDGLPAMLETQKIISAHPDVKLSSRNPDAMSGTDRSKRYVHVQLEDGTWTDLGLHLVQKGLARFLAQKEEYDRNLQYAQAMRTAMKARVGMWKTLGTGPAGALEIKIDWSGNESVTFKNHCPKDIDLTGFWWCDGMTRTTTGDKHKGRGYEFPAGTIIPGGKSLVVHIGEGTDSDLVKYYTGLGQSVFDNQTGDPVWMGDGVYLGNSNGEIVNAAVYPDLSNAPKE